MSVTERLTHLSDRFFDRMRHRDAFAIREEDAVEGSLEPLRGEHYATLVTFRRSGEAVPSPVWFGMDDHGRVFVQTSRDAGKLKRIRNDGRVLIVASTSRGKPRGRPLGGVARELPESEWPHAEAAIAAAYGAGRKVFRRVLADDDFDAYLEIAPVARIG